MNKHTSFVLCVYVWIEIIGAKFEIHTAYCTIQDKPRQNHSRLLGHRRVVHFPFCERLLKFLFCVIPSKGQLGQQGRRQQEEGASLLLLVGGT